MLKKIYKKDGKIIIYNEKLINNIDFYYFLVHNIHLNDSLNDIIKNYYIKKGFNYF
tara:strand:+ start:372 stop:539 length:168 start_codon:yes stop_codon:yes gene_type:complete